MGASHRHCLRLVQYSWLNNHLVNLSINMWWYPIVAWDPKIFLQLFHPHRILVSTYNMHVSIALQGASKIFEFEDLWQLENCILTLPAGFPFRHVYSVFPLYTFVPIFSKNAPQCSSSTSSTSFSLAHSTTSSTNFICHGASSLVFFISESIMMANRKWLKADHWTSTA